MNMFNDTQSIFKVSIPVHLPGQMASLLVADAKWIIPGTSDTPSDDTSAASLIAAAPAPAPSSIAAQRVPRTSAFTKATAATATTPGTGVGRENSGGASPPTSAGSAKLVGTFAAARAAKAMRVSAAASVDASAAGSSNTNSSSSIGAGSSSTSSNAAAVAALQKQLAQKPSPGALKVQLQAVGVSPRLLLDARPAAGSGAQHLKFTVTSADLTAAAAAAAAAAHSSSSGSGGAAALLALPSAMVRQTVLTNPVSIAVSFELRTEGPFSVAVLSGGERALDARSRKRSGVRAALAASTTSATTSTAAVLQSSVPYTVLPGRSITLVLAFTPTAATSSSTSSSCVTVANSRSSLDWGLLTSSTVRGLSTTATTAQTTTTAAAATASSPALHVATAGALCIAFLDSAGQHVQSIALSADVLRPAVMLSPPLHSFGTVHLDTPASATLYLANPTAVNAHWRVTHTPATSLNSTTTSKRLPVANSLDGMLPPPAALDEPSAFTFSHTAGLQRGGSLPAGDGGARLPTDANRSADPVFGQERAALTWHSDAPQTLETSLRAAAVKQGGQRLPFPLVVTFAPRSAGLHMSRFRVAVQGGEGVDVLLQGVGTVEEGTVPNPPPRP
jgi:hypothetical protein